jgi:cytochrome P450
MRLLQPVPSGSQRIVPRGSRGKMVGMQYVPYFFCPTEIHTEQPFSPSYIPEGTSITVHPYTVHRDPRYFSPYASTFWPDRWLAPADRKSLHDVTKPLEEGIDVVTDTAAFFPFSTGPRNCPGKNLGLIEMRTVVSYIVQRFDMNVAEGYDLDCWERSLKDYFVMAKGALPVILTPRLQAV